MYKYPNTRKEAVKDVLHGVELVDNYRWLEDNNSEEVKAWDKAQNDFTKEYTSKLPQNEWLFHKLNENAKYDQVSSLRTLRKSDRIFQSQKKKDEEKWVLYTADNSEAEMRILINPNDWAEDETLAFWVPTQDGTMLAYGVAKGGNEAPVIKIMDIADGNHHSDTVKGWKQYITSWLPDNSGFYYVSNPLKGEVPAGEEFYWRKVYLHKLGTDSSEDIEIFKDDVKETWCSVSLSHDNKYLFYNKGVFYKNAVWIEEFNSGNKMAVSDDFDCEYGVYYFEDKLYIVTNKNAPNRKVFVTSTANPGKENWKELIPEKKFKIDSFAIINGKLYVTYMKNVQTEIRIYELDGTFIKNIALPDTGAASVWGKPDGGTIWVWFSSFTYPGTTFEYNFDSNKLEVFFQPDIKIDYSNMTTKQIWYKSKDGTEIPMFIIHNKDIVLNGNNPTQLYGYGGFNVSLEPGFSTSKALWLQAGGVYVVANLRGGGEFGEEWHRAGMHDKKQNVFDDFIAAAEWLIENKYTCPEKLAVHGGSNGGLLIGAIVTQRPDLMKAALCAVPLLDMIRYHHSSIANIWTEEYGNADNPEQFEYILKYSPYHNVRDNEKYPATMITTGINDARVDPFHARKLTALLQEKNTSDNPIYLLVKDSSGHGGGTTQTIMFKQHAEEMAFVMDQLGMTVPE